MIKTNASAGNNGASVTWRDDADSFENFIIACTRVNDRVSPIVCLEEISRDTCLLLHPECPATRRELDSLLSSMTCLIAAALRFQDCILFTRSIKTAFDVYMTGFDDRGIRKSIALSAELIHQFCGSNLRNVLLLLVPLPFASGTGLRCGTWHCRWSRTRARSRVGKNRIGCVTAF
jgi:hypothetical protein